MSIALFFGSFNPIHIGHLIIAESALLQPEIDQVWFIVSPQNPFKKSENLISEHARYYLAQIATEEHPKFRVSNIEFSLPRPNYTIDTLNYLTEKYPEKTFSLLMGGDNLASLPRWKNYQMILDQYKIFVYKRPQADILSFDSHPHIYFLDVPLIDISATLIRQRIKNQQSIKYLVPEKVIDEIEKCGYFKK